MAANHVLISVNPIAGRRPIAARVEELVDLLRRRDFVVEIGSNLAEISSYANQLHEQGKLRALVGVGGDGTAAELVNRTHPGVPLTVFPSGTSNLLAKQYGLRCRSEDLYRTITEGRLVNCDAGCASGRLFLLMAGIGFDADVVRRVHDLRQSSGGHIGYRTYLKPILQSIRSYPYPQIRLEWEAPRDEGGEERGSMDVRWAFVCNLPRYGWGMPIAPKADATDGLLDLCAFRGRSLWSGLRYVAAIHLGCHQRMADCVTRRVRRIRMTSEDAVPCQLDGDPCGHLPMKIEILPARLTLLVPPEM